ncbi:uracil phosphoribosyltransferase [bacterium SCSIO 12741]|nr:uracil phosphoribosyltransferase [bacterium SCSIO 12741]
MNTVIFNRSHSVLNVFLSELRDTSIQQDPMRFRKNIERIAEVIGYEISKTFSYEPQSVTTPLGTAEELLPQSQPVIASILRAGLSMHSGLLNYFDRAENAFVSAYRIEKDNGDLDFHVEYNASPSLDGKTLILADPMLATGSSMCLAYDALLRHGTPAQVHLASVIGAPEGVEKVRAYFPENTQLWIGAVDEKLNDKSYIVPGLGDAGDLSYGIKE